MNAALTVETDWLTGRRPRLRCPHCGRVERICLPVSADQFITAARDFASQHTACGTKRLSTQPHKSESVR